MPLMDASPVYYRNNVYKISNLEPGDRVRIEPDTATSMGSDIRARTINVIQSVQEGGTSVQIGAVAGRVTSIDRRNNIVRVDTGRGEVRVDLASATDTAGRRVRASDMQIGDRVDLSGSYSGDVFVATTVAFNEEGLPPAANTAPAATPYPTAPARLGAVTIHGTVTQSLANGPRLVVRDTQNGGTVSLYVLEDFTVREVTRPSPAASRHPLPVGEGLSSQGLLPREKVAEGRMRGSWCNSYLEYPASRGCRNFRNGKARTARLASRRFAIGVASRGAL